MTNSPNPQWINIKGYTLKSVLGLLQPIFPLAHRSPGFWWEILPTLVVERPPHLVTDEAGLSWIKSAYSVFSGGAGQGNPSLRCFLREQGGLRSKQYGIAKQAWPTYRDRCQMLHGHFIWRMRKIRETLAHPDLQDSICIKSTDFHSGSFTVSSPFLWGQLFTHLQVKSSLVADCSFDIFSFS